VKVFKVIILLMPVICSEEVLGTTVNHVPPSKCKIAANFIGALVLWKALPNVTRTKYCEHSERWTGMSNGLAWYPIIKGNWKIGLFCLEHRSWEIIPKLVHLLIVKEKSWFTYVLGLLFFPCAFSFISLKYKMLRLNFLSLLEAFNYLLNVYGMPGSGESSPMDENLSPFFSKDVVGYFAKNSKLLWFLFFIPRFSIDMSYFLQNDEDEETEKVF
jgi:hypothetical protein